MQRWHVEHGVVVFWGEDVGFHRYLLVDLRQLLVYEKMSVTYTWNVAK